jgi:hypothetical protein
VAFTTDPALDPVEMYFFRRLSEDLIAGGRPSRMAFCHAGHGLNSYGLT